MIRICTWCDSYMGEKEPLEDTSLTHGICELCAEEMKKKRIARQKEKMMENPVSKRTAMIRIILAFSDAYTNEQLEGMSNFAIVQIYNALRRKYSRNPKHETPYEEFLKAKQQAIAKLRKEWEENKISMHKYNVEKMLWDDQESEYYKDNPLPGYKQEWQIVGQDLSFERAHKVATKWEEKGYEINVEEDKTGKYTVYIYHPKMSNPRAREFKKPSRAEYCPERIVSPSKFDSRSFRTVTSRAHKLTVGCPKGHWDAKRGVCKVPMELQRILHPTGEAKCPVPGKELKNNPAKYEEYGVGLEKVRAKVHKIWDSADSKEQYRILRDTGYVKTTYTNFIVGDYKHTFPITSVIGVKFNNLPLELQDLLIGTEYKYLKNNPAKLATKHSDEIEYVAVELYLQGHGVGDVAILLQDEFGIDRIDAEYYSRRAGRIVRGDVINVAPKIEHLLRAR